MNAIRAIYPYKHAGLWVFDDESAGLDKEPFIAGADTAIDLAVAAKGIENAAEGFRLLFSVQEFPGYDLRFDWVRAGYGGNWYRSDGLVELDVGNHRRIEHVILVVVMPEKGSKLSRPSSSIEMPSAAANWMSPTPR